MGAVAELAASHHGAFTRRQAADIGMRPTTLSRLVQRGTLHEPASGVLAVAGAPSTWHQRATVATLAGRADRGILISEGAAWLHGLDGFPEPTVLRVAVPRGGRVSLAGVVVSQTAGTYPPEDVVEVDGIRCSGLARTICDLARFAPDRHERAADDFQRRGASLAWLEATATRLHRRGRSGSAQALDDVRRRRSGGVVTDSWFEHLVEECVRSSRLPTPIRQFVVRDANGAFVARVDLALPEVRLAVEAHSRRFHTGPIREAADQRRETLMAAAGWETLYVGWSEATQSPGSVRHLVEQVVARRALDLGVALHAR